MRVCVAVRACAYAIEKERAKGYKWQFISASFMLVSLQGQRDTWQCDEAAGVWVHTGVVCVLSTLVCVAMGVCICLWDWGVVLGIKLPSSSTPSWESVTLTAGGHCPPRAPFANLFLCMCLCVYVKGVNFNLAKELNSLVQPRITLDRFHSTDPCASCQAAVPVARLALG